MRPGASRELRLWTWPRRAALGAIRGYQRVVSPWIRPRCRYLPSCSRFAEEAIAKYGIGRGTYLSLRRFVRCHPFGGSGYDPVP